MENTTPSRQPRTHLFFLLLLGMFLVVGGGIALFLKYQAPQKPKNTMALQQLKPTSTPQIQQGGITIPSLQSPLSGNLDVVLKKNPTNPTLTDIYLKNSQTGKETLFLTLPEVYRIHYHPTEFHNGSLYILTRTGGDFGYEKFPDWTDTLWRYTKDRMGTKLFAKRGLDFRVSDGQEYVAAFGDVSQTSPEKELYILNNDGSLIKKFTEKELGLERIDPLLWYKNVFWITSSFEPSLVKLAKIQTPTQQVTTFDLGLLKTNIIDYSLNPAMELLAYSDYPPIFDTDTFEEFQKNKTPVTLFLYNLQTKQKEVIATGEGNRFQPKWLDINTLEYNDLQNGGRTRKTI